MPAPYQAALTTLGRSGDFKDNVLKVNLGRSDLKVTINGRPVPTPLGFGGWVAFTSGNLSSGASAKEDGMNVMMGDLVLTEDQVNPVMSLVLDNGLEATALHNHFFWESPRIFYMHVHGHGALDDLAKKIKPAIDLMMKGVVAGPASPAPALGFDSAALSKIIGAAGEQNGAVYKITLGRADLAVKEMGATINARMGLNTWAAFTGTADNAVVAGDVAMLAKEVTPVLTAMRKAGLSIVSLHHHMIGTEPDIYFLHYWGEGNAETLARGVRSAIDLLGK
ncbi:MAG: DUF1259 domain-containing protein [Acidobacteria bacterium]|nr:MAG: DUF1259 domain-containing protein [Acidobacteriota bacterium]